MSTKKRQNIVYYLFVCLSTLAIALTLAGYLGRLNRYFEFASGYKLQFLLIAWCGIIYFCSISSKSKLWIAVNFCCIVLNLVVILPWYFHQPKIANSGQYKPLKVLSYNVLWSNKNYDKAIALVDREQPDLAIFQEAVPSWHDELTKLESSYPYHLYAKQLEIEVFSKLPLLKPEIKLYGTYRGLVIVDLEIGDRLTKFIATHAYPQLYFGHDGWQIRNRHLEVGIGEYVGHLDQPAIVMGDLNVSLWSPFYNSMIIKSGLRNARQGWGILPTHSVVAPQFAALAAPIDHCLVSSEIKVKSFRLERAIGSDHLPIMAELLIPQANKANN